MTSTEGGVLGAVYEMCQIGKTGAEIWFEKIPVAEVTKKICDCYGLDLAEADLQWVHDDHHSS